MVVMVVVATSLRPVPFGELLLLLLMVVVAVDVHVSRSMFGVSFSVA